MNKDMFKVGANDFYKGAITAVFTGVFVMLYGVVSQAGFDVFSADWGRIFNDVVNIGVATLFGYVSKNFFSDAQGNFLGK